MDEREGKRVREISTELREIFRRLSLAIEFYKDENERLRLALSDAERKIAR